MYFTEDVIIRPPILMKHQTGGQVPSNFMSLNFGAIFCMVFCTEAMFISSVSFQFKFCMLLYVIKEEHKM